MSSYWHERNPSTESTLDMDGGSGLNTNEPELADRARLDVSVQQLLREARDKSKSWVVCSTSDHVDVAFKKVSGLETDSRAIRHIPKKNRKGKQ